MAMSKAVVVLIDRAKSQIFLSPRNNTPDAREDNPQKALEMFQKVVTLESEKGLEIKW